MSNVVYKPASEFGTPFAERTDLFKTEMPVIVVFTHCDGLTDGMFNPQVELSTGYMSRLSIADQAARRFPLLKTQYEANHEQLAEKRVMRLDDYANRAGNRGKTILTVAARVSREGDTDLPYLERSLKLLAYAAEQWGFTGIAIAKPEVGHTKWDIIGPMVARIFDGKPFSVEIYTARDDKQWNGDGTCFDPQVARLNVNTAFAPDLPEEELGPVVNQDEVIEAELAGVDALLHQ